MNAFEDANNVDDFVFNTYKCKRYKRKSYESYSFKEFDGQSLMVSEGYDEMLKSIYGNYMFLFPLEQI